MGMEIDEQKKVVTDFLERCIGYADGSIERKKQRDEDSAEIDRWLAYREFTAIAVAEIERGELDHWFLSSSGDEGASPETGDMGEQMIRKIEATILSEIDHDARASLLAAAITPKPILIASTRSTEGIENAAAVSSVSVVSNTPPLLSVSLSRYRDGRRRDTLVNLDGNPSITLLSLVAEHDACRMVEVAARDLSSDQSEWESMPMPIQERDGIPSPDLALAVIECTCLEMRELPEGAVAELAILRVDRITMPSGGYAPLAQHGLNLVGPAWTERGWTHRLRR